MYHLFYVCFEHCGIESEFEGCTLRTRSKMAAKSSAGYDYEFLDSELASSYECMICQYVVKDPQQAQCCGATYCRCCISRSRRSLAGCPNCRAPSFILIQDKAQAQRINKLRVKCPHCEWIGQLADIQIHLDQEHPQAAAISDDEISAYHDDTAEREADISTHAQTQAASFSDFRTVQHAESNEDMTHECEPLIELKRLDTAEPLKETQDPNSEPPSSHESKTTRFLATYCMDAVYASRTAKL